MFIPVKVEIMVGAICVGILPVEFDNSKQLALANLFKAECTGIKDISNNEREIQVDLIGTPLNDKIWVSEFRISDFTFGGVMVNNFKFDPLRVDAEDEAWLKKNLLNAKSPTPSQASAP